MEQMERLPKYESQGKYKEWKYKTKREIRPRMRFQDFGVTFLMHVVV